MSLLACRFLPAWYDEAMSKTYFWSGSNHAGEIDGLARAGRNIGVAIHQLDAKGQALGALLDLAPLSRVVVNVQRNSSGRAILMLGRKRDLLPAGDATVDVDGEQLVVGFRRIAANVARAALGAANKLDSVLRGWFGDDAGRPGSGHRVVVELSRSGWRMSPAQLDELAASGSRVFVDSGAFSEVTFGANGPTVVAPITDADWRERLAAMTRIGERLGSRAYLVAPDQVGDQAETLRRLERYAEAVRGWRRAGANVIVVLQAGELSQSEMDRQVTELLGFGDYVRGIPSKKAAASTEQIAALVTELPRGARVHLLGLGPHSPRFAQVVDAIEAAGNDVVIYCDSVRLKALVGRSNGRGGSARILTALRDQVIADGACRSTREIKAETLRRYFATTACAW